MSEENDKVICTWDNSNIIERLLRNIGEEYTLLECIKGDMCCLELSKNGIPKHSLQLRKNLTLIKYENYEHNVWNTTKKD